MACLMALTASFLCVCVCVFSQELFLENYFESQRDHIFTNVQVLIYVFDIESRDLEVRMPHTVATSLCAKAGGDAHTPMMARLHMLCTCVRVVCDGGLCWCVVLSTGRLHELRGLHHGYPGELHGHTGVLFGPQDGPCSRGGEGTGVSLPVGWLELWRVRHLFLLLAGVFRARRYDQGTFTRSQRHVLQDLHLG